MNNIVFDQVTKAYEKNVIVKEMNLSIREGERLILLGPSGCGKSTTLRMIAGLEDVTAGDLYMSGKRINDVPCGKRNVSMVFQNYAIYPHMTVRQNIIYGLKAAGTEKTEIEKRLKDVLEMLNLEELADRKPRDLSGGQRQRVALARAVVKRSPYFLLDEPLSNLDAQLRVHARKELVRIHEKYHQTMVYVTHDQIEAMTVGQRIAVMHNGVMEMVDTPENVYDHPDTVFCARFIGSPAMNIFETENAGGSLRIGKSLVHMPLRWKKILEKHPAKKYKAGIRPEHISFVKPLKGETVSGTVRYIEDYGNRVGVYVQPDGLENDVIVICDDSRVPELGSRVNMAFRFDRFHMFDSETEQNIDVAEEQETEKDGSFTEYQYVSDRQVS